MDTGSFMALGMMVGVMVAAFFLSRKKRSDPDNEYDEMQLKIRAKGYQIGFYTALGMMGVLIFLAETNLLQQVTTGLAVFAALLASVTVFAVYCILNDAFLSMRGNAGSHLGIFGIVVVLEGAVAIRYLLKGEMLENGKLGFSGGAPALMFICFLAILVTLIVKTVRNRKGAEE